MFPPEHTPLESVYNSYTVPLFSLPNSSLVLVNVIKAFSITCFVSTSFTIAFNEPKPVTLTFTALDIDVPELYTASTEMLWPVGL